MPKGCPECYGKKGKKSIKEKMFSEVMHNPPKVVEKTKAKKGAKAARKQSVAIALSKTRKAGGKY